MNIHIVSEGRRGCGFRKPGGLYLRTDGTGRYCGALPTAIFHVFKPSRIEYVVKETDEHDKLEALEKRGITLVTIKNPQEAELALV